MGGFTKDTTEDLHATRVSISANICIIDADCGDKFNAIFKFISFLISCSWPCEAVLGLAKHDRDDQCRTFDLGCALENKAPQLRLGP